MEARRVDGAGRPKFDFHTGNNVHLVEHAVGVEVEVAARLPELDVRDVRRVEELVPARSIIRSERPQSRKRDHPLPSFLETTRVDGVKASLKDAESAPALLM